MAKFLLISSIIFSLCLGMESTRNINIIDGQDYTHYKLPPDYLALIRDGRIVFDLLDLNIFNDENLVRKGETRIIRDGKASLTVPSTVLKREDGKAVNFPVCVYLKYVDPRKHIDLMPGRDMLASDDEGNLMSLYSYAAVNIIAVDSRGGRVVLDREAVFSNGQTTVLRFETDTPQPRETLRWTLDIGSGVWQPFDDSTRTELDRLGFGGWERESPDPEGWEGEGQYDPDANRRWHWEENVVVRDIELAPFNLDVPKKAVPFKIYVWSKRPGKYQVKLGGDDSAVFWGVSRVAEIKDKPVAFKILVPEETVLNLSVYPEHDKDRSICNKDYRTMKAEHIYTWDRSSKDWEIVRDNGSKIKWQLYDQVAF